MNKYSKEKKLTKKGKINPKRKSKKTKKQKKKIYQKYKSRYLIDLLNLTNSHYYTESQTPTDYFDYRSDKCLVKYIERKIKEGWNIFQNKSKMLELHCHSLCLSTTIINYHLSKKKWNDLDELEKLYLFFISYFSNINHREETIPLELSLKRIDQRIETETKKLNEYKQQYGISHKKTKQCEKNIKRHKKRKEELLKGEGTNFTLDVCNNIDCDYLIEQEKLNYIKGKKEKKSFEKLCRNITYCFKGAIWILL